MRWVVRTDKGDFRFCDDCTHAAEHSKYFIKIVGQVEQTKFHQTSDDEICSMCKEGRAAFKKAYLEKGAIKTDFVCLACACIMSRMGIQIP
jgi:hypothetical protein